MTATGMDSLVDVDWVARRLDRQDLRVLDASWHLPTSGRDARAEYLDAHVPGARYFDIDRIADPDSDLPHMLPTEEHFAKAVGSLGIGNDTQVVVYDSHGLFAAARVWWMFRVFGHAQVAVLDGGLPAWRAAGLPLETGAVQARPVAFDARLEPRWAWSLAQVRANLDTAQAQVIDARPAGRFAGTAPEPRPGLRAGHIPGSLNLPFDRVTDPDTHHLRPPAALRSLFHALDDRPVVCTCGTGVSACVLAFALDRLGRDDVAVYDGSWTEWGGRDDTPVETGSAQGSQFT